jgi:hypothetical protein
VLEYLLRHIGLLDGEAQSIGPDLPRELKTALRAFEDEPDDAMAKREL